MYQNLVYLVAVISFLIVILILLQPSKQQDVLSLLSTDKSDKLLENSKARGGLFYLRLGTAILGMIWFVLGIYVVYLSN